MRAVVDKSPKGFGKEPAKFRYDVCFLKPSVTAKQVAGSRSDEGGRGSHLGRHGRRLLLEAHEQGHLEPLEPGGFVAGLPADDDPELEHDDEAARAPRRGDSLTDGTAIDPRRCSPVSMRRIMLSATLVASCPGRPPIAFGEAALLRPRGRPAPSRRRGADHPHDDVLRGRWSTRGRRCVMSGNRTWDPMAWVHPLDDEGRARSERLDHGQGPRDFERGDPWPAHPRRGGFLRRLAPVADVGTRPQRTASPA